VYGTHFSNTESLQFTDFKVFATGYSVGMPCADIPHTVMNSMSGMLTVPTCSTLKSVRQVKNVKIKILYMVKELCATMYSQTVHKENM
jgi:hypothetical protein